jgi:hypothetical protein
VINGISAYRLPALNLATPDGTLKAQLDWLTVAEICAEPILLARTKFMVTLLQFVGTNYTELMLPVKADQLDSVMALRFTYIIASSSSVKDTRVDIWWNR